MKDLEAFIKEDRAWFRDQRIGHAKYQLSQAKSADDKKFWQAVLDRNNN